MSDKTFDSFYREIFADLAVDREESVEIQEKFNETNPPPDKLLALRSAVFRVGSEFLTDDNDSNTKLLRCMSAIVNILERTCMVPKGNGAEGDDFDEETVESVYRECFSDLSVDRHESQELVGIFLNIPKSKLAWTRMSVFRIGSEFLTDTKEGNVSLFKCMNSIVRMFEISCLTPKPYTLKTEPSFNMDISVSKAVQHLWNLDVNRATANRDYKINVGLGKKPYHKHDAAREDLFSFVDTRDLFQRPTYKSFIALLDNYTAETGISERVTHVEKQENRAFIDAIMQSGPMQFCHKYCCKHNSDVPTDVGGFKKLLHKIWFELYYRERGGGPDSSGFEHVFVGEIKNDKISGFHNWIQFYLEEKKGNIDYRGYIKPKGRDNAETNDDDNILTIQFTWNGYEKFVGSSFIGVSPEFEMALYTMCFLAGEESNWIELETDSDFFEIEVKVYRMAKDKIGTSYPEAKSHYE